MPRVMFYPAGVDVEVREGTTLLDAALDNNIRIDHICGGNCACSSCHVVIEKGFENLGAMSEDELDMLEDVETRAETSRLACQCKVTAELVVRIPEKQFLPDGEL